MKFEDTQDEGVTTTFVLTTFIENIIITMKLPTQQKQVYKPFQLACVNKFSTWFTNEIIHVQLIT
jgi:hypothetical protein